MKLIIAKKHQSVVKMLKREIARRTKEEDKLFISLCKRMNIVPDSDESNILWDHVFNRTDWLVEYAKK